MAVLVQSATDTLPEVRLHPTSTTPTRTLSNSAQLIAAAFLEFHAPLAAWIHSETRGPTGEDTLLASGELYNNSTRMDVWYKSHGHA